MLEFYLLNSVFILMSVVSSTAYAFLFLLTTFGGYAFFKKKKANWKAIFSLTGVFFVGMVVFSLVIISSTSTFRYTLQGDTQSIFKEPMEIINVAPVRKTEEELLEENRKLIEQNKVD